MFLGQFIIAIPVGAPLPHVATHVINAQFVWGFGGNGVGLTATVVTIPRHSVRVAAAAVFAGTAIHTATACIFPFRLGGQTELLPGKLIEFFDKIQTVVVANTLYRSIVANEIRWIVAHHSLPKRLRHLGLTN